MDDFKRAIVSSIGPGGLSCPCCSPYRTTKGKKKGLSRLARSRLKREDRLEVINYEHNKL